SDTVSLCLNKLTNELVCVCVCLCVHARVCGSHALVCLCVCAYKSICVCVCVSVYDGDLTCPYCGITMGQLSEGCGVRVDVWLPHHKMAAMGTTSPRMQQDPTRCRCLRHLME